MVRSEAKHGPSKSRVFGRMFSLVVCQSLLMGCASGLVNTPGPAWEGNDYVPENPAAATAGPPAEAAQGSAAATANEPASPVVIDNRGRAAGKMMFQARRDLDLSGPGFSLRHVGAHPQAVGASAGASEGLRGEGGRITGQVCGQAVDVQVLHMGDHVSLAGALGGVDAALAVEDRAGGRYITGTLGPAEVDLRLLQPRGEKWQAHGWVGAQRLDVSLVGAASALPAADVGVVAALLPACPQ